MPLDALTPDTPAQQQQYQEWDHPTAKVAIEPTMTIPVANVEQWWYHFYVVGFRPSFQAWVTDVDVETSKVRIQLVKIEPDAKFLDENTMMVPLDTNAI